MYRGIYCNRVLFSYLQLQENRVLHKSRACGAVFVVRNQKQADPVKPRFLPFFRLTLGSFLSPLVEPPPFFPTSFITAPLCNSTMSDSDYDDTFMVGVLCLGTREKVPGFLRRW